MKITHCFLLFFSVSLTSIAQKYLDYYNDANYLKSIEACDKVLEKNKSDLQVYLYKSLAYAHLGADAITRDGNKPAAEKSLGALQVIQLKDKNQTFIQAHSSKVDSIIMLTRTAASWFFDNKDMWHAGRIVDLLVKLSPNAEVYYLYSKILMEQGETYDATMQLNYAARDIYLDYKNGKNIDPDLIHIFSELAEGLYQTGDLHSAITIMDRSLWIFPGAESKINFVVFIQTVADDIVDNAADSIYTTLLFKLDSLETVGAGHNNNLRWELIQNRLYAEASEDITLCETDIDINAIYNGYDEVIRDSIITFLNTEIIQSTFIQLMYGKGAVTLDTCVVSALINLNTIEPQLTGKLKAIVEDAFNRNDLHTAAILVYVYSTKKKYKNDWSVWRSTIITELQNKYEQVGYDLELRKLLFLFEDEPVIKKFTYTTSQEKVRELIGEKQFSKAGEILRILLQQNPNDPVTKSLQKEWVIADYKSNYVNISISDEDLKWNGDFTTCNAGTISKEAQQIFISALNYYRRLAGVPDSCVLSDSLNIFCQNAAFAMDANNALSHGIDTKWQCYSIMANTGASNSNLSLGYHSTSALYGQIEDSGSGNQSVGHRRWILNPYRKVFGHGSTPDAMALWALGGRNTNYPGEVTEVFKYQYVLWPPQGYVPANFICSRWSVSLANADFSKVQVKVMLGKKNIPVTIYPLENGYGQPTLVFNIPDIDYWLQAEITYYVEITGIHIYNQPDIDIKYSITFIPIEP
ncbi:MAG: hypothetical protein WAU21_04620 [Chitinophagales bacterium]|nr:hypothetical protein [Bacteroidota bacterium]